MATEDAFDKAYALSMAASEDSPITNQAESNTGHGFFEQQDDAWYTEPAESRLIAQASIPTSTFSSTSSSSHDIPNPHLPSDARLQQQDARVEGDPCSDIDVDGEQQGHQEQRLQPPQVTLADTLSAMESTPGWMPSDVEHFRRLALAGGDASGGHTSISPGSLLQRPRCEDVEVSEPDVEDHASLGSPASVDADPIAHDGTAAQEEPGRATTFTRFQELPAELRIMTWEFTFVPRIVNVTRESSVDDSGTGRRSEVDRDEMSHRWNFAHLHDWGRDSVDQNAFSASSPLSWDEMAGRMQPSDRNLVRTITTTWCAPPATLAVNREARLKTLQHYRLCFGLAGGRTNVWFNFDVDYLLLHGGSFNSYPQLLKMLERRDLLQLRNVVVWHNSRHQSACGREYQCKTSPSDPGNFCTVCAFGQQLRTENASELHPYATGEWAFDKLNRQRIQLQQYQTPWYQPQLNVNCQLTGLGMRLPALQNIVVIVDSGEGDGLDHPIDIEPGTFGGFDFRYISSPSDADRQSSHWNLLPYVLRFDTGAIQVRDIEHFSRTKVCQYLDTSMAENPLRRAGTRPQTDRFTCKIRIGERIGGLERLQQVDVGGSLHDNGGGWRRRLLDARGMAVQLFNEAMERVAKVLHPTIPANATMATDFGDPANY